MWMLVAVGWWLVVGGGKGDGKWGADVVVVFVVNVEKKIRVLRGSEIPIPTLVGPEF